ncbi:uncharacterized protein EV422DRAFT_200964 [Fimicolochytrium jonesii]|uniref:uncharacterized protein n=1 Tax=Fimicolochytrium jonesii TaxID=1396493 RepID=UPI0022FE897F|nr:uncharacterized protein EV422DRAFT_200964 [Fimicolochytrium jonesii]KAI8817985.1 hypothetical protein EV422DRAFT_200964 [Fimicolochytrium jonesii]
MVKEVSAMEQGVAVTVLHATSSGKDIKKASSSDAPSKPISKTAQLDDAFSTPSTATPAHAPHAPLKASYAARVFGRHLMNALACMVPYVLAAMLPIQIVYDKGSKEGAFTLWIFESFFLSNFSECDGGYLRSEKLGMKRGTRGENGIDTRLFSFSFSPGFVYSNVFWHRSLLGLPFTFRHDFKAIQLPCLVCAVVTCGVYILVGRAFTWPLNNPASAVWGGTQYTTVPPLTTWFLLPKEMKAEPGFLKRFLWNAYVPANAFVFFFMTA